jgi:2-keto-4-pentenoate hydratase/2-oxohepta-3-ene-1,7-dioic acid hydratase in catechol pathway
MEIAEVLAPVQPMNVICIGRNWRDPHAPHDASGANESLEVFLKPSTAVQAPGAPIVVPDFGGVDLQLDCEGELAVVIGAPARNVTEEEARKVVLGYTAANDVTARRWQTSSGPSLWMRGKGFDTFCPLGPVIVTDSEIDPSELIVRTLINDVPVREGSTRDMVRSVPAIVSELSRHLTLGPGTVVLTGAPPARGNHEPITPGQEVVVEIEGIGRLVNRVEA